MLLPWYFKNHITIVHGDAIGSCMLPSSSHTCWTLANYKSSMHHIQVKLLTACCIVFRAGFRKRGVSNWPFAKTWPPSVAIKARNKHECTLEGILFKLWEDVNTCDFKFKSTHSNLLSVSADSATWSFRPPVNQAPCKGSNLVDKSDKHSRTLLTTIRSLWFISYFYNQYLDY